MRGEHDGALLVALLLDGPEQAVELAHRLLDLGGPHEAAATTLPFDHALGLEAPDGVAGGVSAHAVLVDQVLVGRETLFELPGPDAPAEGVEHLGPQGQGAASVREARSGHGINVRTSGRGAVAVTVEISGGRRYFGR